MALTLDLTDVLDESEIVNDRRLSGDRHSPWMAAMDEIANAVNSDVIASGKFVKIAEFTAASGARARQKQLEAAGVELPHGVEGKWRFKPSTWIGEDKKRHSTLRAAFLQSVKWDAPETAEVEADDAEEYAEEV